MVQSGPVTTGEIRHPSDYEIGGIIPSEVVAPASPAATAEVVSSARERGLAVVPWGNGTAQSGGALPTRYHVACLTSAMGSVIEYEPADLVITVGAGMPIGQVQATLAAAGQFLALDGVDARATVGGIVATNRSGPSRLLYGSARDLVLGITVALPNGDVVRSGGRVVKNVVGYDLNKLHVGGLGTLGVICEVTFKVHPSPRAEASVIGWFSSAETANVVALDLARSNLGLRAVDVTSDSDDASAEGVTTISAWCSGWPDAVARQCREVATIISAAGATTVHTMNGGDHDAARARVEALRVRGARLKVTALPSKLGQLQLEVARVTRVGDRPCATWVARAGIGIAHVGLSELDQALLAEIRSCADAAGGTCVIEAGADNLKTPDLAWGTTRADFRVMTRIRDEFDPNRTINPGRYVGGL